MTIAKKRLEELSCQFLMMAEIICKEDKRDIMENIRQLTNVTEEELKELNFPIKYYEKLHDNGR